MKWDFSFISQHKGVIALVVLGGALVLFLYWRSSNSAATSTTVATSSGVDPQVQATEVQAAGQIQLAQQQTTAQANQYQFQLAAITASAAASAQLATLQNQATVAAQANTLTAQQNLAKIQADVQSQSIGAQEHVQLAQVDAATAATQANDAAAVTENTLADQLALGVAQAQSAANVSVAGINADLQKTILTTNVGAQLHLADLQAGLQANQQTLQAGITDKTIGLIQSGQLNKGGAGGANQVAVLGAILGAPGIAYPAYQTATASFSGGNSIGGILAGAGGLAQAILGK
jgi:hypothetical protein